MEMRERWTLSPKGSREWPRNSGSCAQHGAQRRTRHEQCNTACSQLVRNREPDRRVRSYLLSTQHSGGLLASVPSPTDPILSRKVAGADFATQIQHKVRNRRGLAARASGLKAQQGILRHRCGGRGGGREVSFQVRGGKRGSRATCMPRVTIRGEGFRVTVEEVGEQAAPSSPASSAGSFVLVEATSLPLPPVTSPVAAATILHQLLHHLPPVCLAGTPRFKRSQLHRPSFLGLGIGSSSLRHST